MNPVLLEDAAGFRVIDAAKAAEYKKSRLAKLIGEKFCKLVDDRNRKMHMRLEVFKMRKSAETPAFMGGESARMTPSRPTSGNIWSGTYARRLNGLVHEHRASVEMFKAWKPKVKLATASDNAGVVSERSILFFPAAGQLTKYIGKGRRSRYVDAYR